MVQASSFLLLLAFSAVMIQGAPLAAHSKEHHTKDKPPIEESKLQIPDGASGSPQRSGSGGTGGTRSAQAGPPVKRPSCMDPQFALALSF
ncbi:hypothetical protein BCR42DRAFT_443335 [Absidia repens]|uniref:Uncharacterized protein n=1 Tax=Absidia repens TaxID=90262 RepID=A0A1X2HZR4_9FUNG|nr:hypothetical protein BCR42DRAFT_443335 [Absidia repens]